MMSNEDDDRRSRMDLSHHVTLIVTAYISRNKVSEDQLPTIIEAVHGALCRLALDDKARSGLADAPLRPAVSVRDSVQPNYLVCLEDGKKMQSLKRHLHAAHGLSLEQYAARWGLPRDYPTVAPNYSALRSQLAKSGGLGRANSKHKRP